MNISVSHGCSSFLGIFRGLNIPLRTEEVYWPWVDKGEQDGASLVLTVISDR
jgi:hypothetical protein